MGSVKELRFLADHLGVDIRTCLEKHELVHAIVDSGCVDILPVEQTPLLRHGNATSTPPTLALPALTHGEGPIQSFLVDCPSFATLAKRSAGALTINIKPRAP